jgi:predicted Zn-dependent protease
VSLSKAAAKLLTQQVLSHAKVDDIVVRVAGSQTGNTRFANNGPTTTGDVARATVSVTATVQGRSATISSNRTDKESLARIVREAEETAALAPVDPEHMPPVGPQKYPRVNGRDGATAKLGGKERAQAIRKPLATADKRGLNASGLIIHSDSAFALANNKGLFAYHASTSVSLSNTCRTKDGTGSGRAAFVSHRYGNLKPGDVARAAADKAEMSANPKGVDPGRYVVILEPQAVSDLLSFLAFSMGARSADEGRSYFSKAGGGNRIGEKLFHDSITISSDPGDAEHPASPISGDGLPLSKVTWIEKGVLKALTYSRFWADKQGKEPVPRPNSIKMAGTDASLTDLIKGVDRGILVTRFWYNRMLEPRTILATGLTRDGTFLVEQGKITTAVKNFRYNESPVTLLKNVLALGKPERAPTRGGRVVVVPPMVVDGFNFASLSDAV